MRQPSGQEYLVRFAINVASVSGAGFFTLAFLLRWMPGDLAALLVGVCLLPSVYLATRPTSA